MQFWDAEKDAFIILNYKKMRAQQIANILFVTKNAVIGRAKRLGLCSSKEPRLCSPKDPTVERPSGRKRKQRENAMTWTTPTLVSWRLKGFDRIKRMLRPRPNPVLVASTTGGITIMYLTYSTCRFPISGSGAGMFYCGAGIYKEQKYCLTHCHVAFYRFKG